MVYPRDIKHVMAIGESMTIGWAQLNLPLEFRGRSFSMGGDPKVTTMPNILEELANVTLNGKSHGTKPISRAQCDQRQFERVCGLNAALEGAGVSTAQAQLDYIQAHLDDESGWKLITVFIGLADAVFGSTPEEHFKEQFGAVLKRLSTWHNTFANVVLLPTQIAGVRDIIARHPVCRFANAVDHSRIANFSWTNSSTWNRRLAGYNRRIAEVASDVKDTPSFRLRTRHFFEDFRPNDSLVEKIDCFHPNAKLSAAMAVGLWNEMIRGSFSWDLEATPVPLDEDTQFY